MTNSTQVKKFTLHRIEIIGIILVIVVPALLAWIIYTNPGLINLSHSNYGTIIQPAKPVPSYNFNQLGKNEPINLESLRGRWVLLSIAGDECSEKCQDNLFKIRQMRRALGKDRGRIERLVILLNDQSREHYAKFTSQYPGVLFASGSRETLKNFINFLPNVGNSLKDHVFIIDPLGNLMMHYQPGADGVKMLNDLEKLLKISKIG